MAFEPFKKGELPSMANFNEKILSAIEEAARKALDEGVQIETGSYDGTEGGVLLKFGITPKIIFLYVSNSTGGAPWMPVATIPFLTGEVYVLDYGGGSPSRFMLTTNEQENTISWYSIPSSATRVYNNTRCTYSYIAVTWKETP